MANSMNWAWKPERVNTASVKGEKRGRVRVSATLVTQIQTSGKSNAIIKRPAGTVREFGNWFALHYPIEAKELIGALREKLQGA